MPTSIYSPDTLSPEQLDHFLAKAWRPVGQRLYEADFIQLEPGLLCNLLPSRLALSSHRWTKKQRKLMRTNQQVFRVEYGPAHLSAEKKRVNGQYALVHGEKTVEDLSYHLSFEGRKIFKTWETRVYHGKKLVAFSFFDLGESSAYSKAGIYDPGFERFSLGLFTLYLEIDFCKEHGLTHFYPGYVSPDTPIFDYKHRIGNLDLWDLRTAQWRPEAQFPLEERCHIQHIRQKLLELSELLVTIDWPAKPYTYLSSDIRLSFDNFTHFIDAPAILPIYTAQNIFISLVCYNLAEGRYELKDSMAVQISYPDGSNEPDWPSFQFVLRDLKTIATSTKATDMIPHIQTLIKQQKKDR